MSHVVKLKYEVYYHDAIFNYKTKKYESTDGTTYSSRGEAKESDGNVKSPSSWLDSLRNLQFIE